MFKESPETNSLQSLSQDLQRLGEEMERAQTALEQTQAAALALAAQNKEEFQALLEAKQQAWRQQEVEWQNQRAAYEQRLAELESFFKAQVNVAEQNALRSLNDLDAAWQSDKASWQQSLHQQEKEFQDREVAWSLEREKEAQRLQALEDQIKAIQAHLLEAERAHADQHEQDLAVIAEYQAQAEKWQRDQTLWRHREEFSVTELHRQQQRLDELQAENDGLRSQVLSADQTENAQRQRMESYVASLEAQVAALNEFIRPALPSSSISPLGRAPQETTAVPEPALSAAPKPGAQN